jgi:hypothetical protein
MYWQIAGVLASMAFLLPQMAHLAGLEIMDVSPAYKISEGASL